MLYSQKQERSRRFKLALRMGVPILLLVGLVVYSIFTQNHYDISALDLAIFVSLFFVAIYFLFFLIGVEQTESLVDPMTCAFNRSALTKNLTKRIPREKQYTLTLLRIDNLPFINDHFGIDRGDRLLRVFVRLLDDHLQMNGIKDPVIGRYHGGDFVIGLSSSVEKSEALMEDFTSTYKEIGNIAVEYKYATVPIQKAEELEPLITHLYDTLSLQKERSVEHSDRQERALDVNRLERDIVEAVERRALQLHFLPTRNLQTGKEDLFEVGVRLVTEGSGVLPPKKFIPVINRLGLEKRFDEALFEAICDVATQVREEIGFSFNISPFSLRNEAFAHSIQSIASRHGIAYNRIVIELYENRPFKEISRYKAILDELRELGIRFCLDNFGAANASFEYIKKLPVDMVQFDREFTTAYSNRKIAALLEGYVKACRQMGVLTLAKWVDTAETLKQFEKLGIDYVQGFIVAKGPMEKETFIKTYGENP